MKWPKNLDPSSLPFVGAGKEGRVYRIDDNRCIKLYNHDKYRKRELAALKRGANDPLLPKLYDWGSGFTIREYIRGIPLNEYLKKHALDLNLAGELLRMHETLIKLGFHRADLRLTHVILTPDGRLRVIDPTNLMKVRRAFPRKMLHDLERYGHLDSFLAMTQRLRPDIFQAWSKRLG